MKTLHLFSLGLYSYFSINGILLRFHIVLFLLVNMCSKAMAQPEIGQGWLMGYGLENSPKIDSPYGVMLLNFEKNNDVSIERTELQSNLLGANTSITDSDGKLVLYSNGNYLADKSGNKLFVLNDGAKRGQLDVNSTVLLPFDDDRYVLAVSMSEIDSVHGRINVVSNECRIIGFTYNNSDFRLNWIDTLLIDRQCFPGNFSVVEHGEVANYWLIAASEVNMELYSMHISSSGVNEIVVNKVDNYAEHGLGMMMVSPNGKKLARVSAFDTRKNIQISTSSFDRCNGVIDSTNTISIPKSDQSLVSSLAFSPNSRFIYLNSHFKFWQLDLSERLSEDAIIQIDSFDGFADPFSVNFGYSGLAADDKIYNSSTNSSKYLHCVNQPNKKGVDCDFRAREVVLPYFTCATVPFLANNLTPKIKCTTTSADHEKICDFAVIPHFNEIVVDKKDCPELDYMSIALYDVHGRLLFKELFYDETITLPRHTYIINRLTLLVIESKSGERIFVRKILM